MDEMLKIYKFLCFSYEHIKKESVARYEKMYRNWYASCRKHPQRADTFFVDMSKAGNTPDVTLCYDTR